MKKLFLLSVMLIASCNSLFAPDTEFKNPIFYQPLEPLGSTEGWEYLTPTSVDFRAPWNDNEIRGKGKCVLIENKQNRITLKCKLESWGKFYNSYLTYVIKDQFTKNCLRILEYSYDTPRDFPKDEMYAAKFCVTPPNQLSSKPQPE